MLDPSKDLALLLSMALKPKRWAHNLLIRRSVNPFSRVQKSSFNQAKELILPLSWIVSMANFQHPLPLAETIAAESPPVAAERGSGGISLCPELLQHRVKHWRTFMIHGSMTIYDDQ